MAGWGDSGSQMGSRTAPSEVRWVLKSHGTHNNVISDRSKTESILIYIKILLSPLYFREC